MFALSGEFIIQMFIRSLLWLIVLCAVFLLLKKYGKNVKLAKMSFWKFSLACIVIIFLINLAFVINARIVFDKMVHKIINGESCKFINSEMVVGAEDYRKEVKITKDTKSLLMEFLSDQKYTLKAYGYSLATLEYLKIEMGDKDYIQIIGGNFIAFKSGIFDYSCVSENDNLLKQLRELMRTEN